jgi:hypothetical protein
MTTITTKPRGRSMTARRLTVALAATGAMALAVPAIGHAATKFGAGVSPQMQPSNASVQGAPCFTSDPGQCTRVSPEAYTLGPGGGREQAPKERTIDKLRLIARGPGHFRFQLAEAKPNQEKAKIVRQGPVIEHEGQSDPNPPYEVETFNVDVPVEKGQYLAIKARRTSMLRCSSGGPNQLLFQPALTLGGPFAGADGTDGCWLLLQAVYE